MSASLVGSEMCIRDSPSPQPQRASRSAWRSIARGRRSARRLTSRGRRTVSYTHLTLPTICSV
eukprot:15421124-Alexandrium_andersonii.AAC.1